MQKDGYVIKVRDTNGGDEEIQYMVGPRGRMEVGTEGVKGLVKKVYGKIDTEAEELEKRIEKSLEHERKKELERENGKDKDNDDGDGDEAPKKRGRRKTKQDVRDDDDEMDEDSD